MRTSSNPNPSPNPSPNSNPNRQAFKEKFAWQSDESVDPLIEFKRRQKEGKLNPIGYEDEEEVSRHPNL